jgi:hypothetical protein
MRAEGRGLEPLAVVSRSRFQGGVLVRPDPFQREWVRRELNPRLPEGDDFTDRCHDPTVASHPQTKSKNGREGTRTPNRVHLRRFSGPFPRPVGPLPRWWRRKDSNLHLPGGTCQSSFADQPLRVYFPAFTPGLFATLSTSPAEVRGVEPPGLLGATRSPGERGAPMPTALPSKERASRRAEWGRRELNPRLLTKSSAFTERRHDPTVASHPKTRKEGDSNPRRDTTPAAAFQAVSSTSRTPSMDPRTQLNRRDSNTSGLFRPLTV